MIRTVFGRQRQKSFIGVYDTRNTLTGGSSSNQLKIMLQHTNFNPFTIFWGDGSSDYITAYNSSLLTKTYSSSGIYEVKIVGGSFGFSNPLLERLKILEIKNWGGLYLYINSFKGCINLSLSNVIGKPFFTISAESAFEGTTFTHINGLNEWDFSKTDGSASVALIGLVKNNPNFNQVINLSGPLSSVAGMLSGCTSFNSSVTITSNILTIASQLLQNATSFNSSLTINSTSLSIVVGLLQGASVFNKPIVVTSNVIVNATFMFRDTKAYNQDITINITNTTGLNAFLFGAIAFNKDLSGLNFNKDADVQSLLLGKTAATYSPIFLSNLYITFATKFIGVGRTQVKSFSAGSAKYDSSGSTARAALIADGWTLTDGGVI